MYKSLVFGDNVSALLIIRAAFSCSGFAGVIVCDLNGCRYTEYLDGSLKITAVGMEDSGNYSCEISTKLDSVSAAGSISVQGESATVTCLASPCF